MGCENTKSLGKGFISLFEKTKTVGWNETNFMGQCGISCEKFSFPGLYTKGFVFKLLELSSVLEMRLTSDVAACKYESGIGVGGPDGVFFSQCAW